MQIRIEHYGEAGYCDGAVNLGRGRKFPVPVKAKIIGLRIGRRLALFDREELLDFAEQLRRAAHDG